ncbi:GTPase inhibitor [Coprinopsis sp. MPI-PUGE-AT-0042]|nr:GTPase inhibitor [Coprinopsis sp. MPI-PUGE-AT-0042]
MANNPNEDTEFNEILRKHGILPERPKTPPTPSPPGSPTFDDLLNESTVPELEKLNDRLQNDDDKLQKVERERRRRMEDELRTRRDARFGEVIPISREDYTREVTEASAKDAEDDDNEKGTGVVCLLYKDGIPHSDRAKVFIRNLAAKYPQTKFVSIVGDKCIENLPDTQIPMILLYRKGDLRNRFMAWGRERERLQEELEAVLLLSGAIDPNEALLASNQTSSSSTREDDLSEDEEEWDNDRSSKMRSAATSVNARAPRNIRGPAKKNKDDDDSDFEFDL